MTTLKSLGSDPVDRDLLLDIKPHLAAGEHRFHKFPRDIRTFPPSVVPKGFSHWKSLWAARVSLWCGMPNTVNAEPRSVICWILGAGRKLVNLAEPQFPNL